MPIQPGDDRPDDGDVARQDDGSDNEEDHEGNEGSQAGRTKRRWHIEQEKEGDRATGDDQGDGQRVEDILERDGRECGHQWRAMADEHGLRRLAEEQAERRDVAEGVAGDERRQRVAQPQPAILGAQRPREGADDEARTRQGEDDREARPDTADAVDDWRQPGLTNGPREEEQTGGAGRQMERREAEALFDRSGHEQQAL